MLFSFLLVSGLVYTAAKNCTFCQGFQYYPFIFMLFSFVYTAPLPLELRVSNYFQNSPFIFKLLPGFRKNTAGILRSLTPKYDASLDPDWRKILILFTASFSSSISYFYTAVYSGTVYRIRDPILFWPLDPECNKSGSSDKHPGS